MPPERKSLNSLFDSLEEWEEHLKGEFSVVNSDELQAVIEEVRRKKELQSSKESRPQP